jgi:hypothetical protein
VSRIQLNDRVPGAQPDTFHLPGGALILIMRIASPGKVPSPRLFMRCEADGQMFAALEKAEQLTGRPEV